MSNVADYVYFVLIYNFINDKIRTFGMHLMTHMMTWASAIALTLVTLWILIQGYRIITGQSRELMMQMVINASRITIIVTAATTMSIMGANLHDLLTVGLDHEVNSLFTDDSDRPRHRRSTRISLTHRWL